MRSGLSYALEDRLVSRLLAVQALASFATGATSAMLVVLSERHLKLPPEAFAWLMGAKGLGALVGPLIPQYAGPGFSGRELVVRAVHLP